LIDAGRPNGRPASSRFGLNRALLSQLEEMR
jgi:hypothetical protein